MRKNEKILSRKEQEEIAKKVSSGKMTINQARILFGLHPKSGGDQYITSEEFSNRIQINQGSVS